MEHEDSEEEATNTQCQGNAGKRRTARAWEAGGPGGGGDGTRRVLVLNSTVQTNGKLMYGREDKLRANGAAMCLYCSMVEANYPSA